MLNYKVPFVVIISEKKEIKHTLVPLSHKALTMAYETLLGFPQRRTWLASLGILLRTIATTKLLPSTIFILSSGYFFM